jgi:hypothetical protein
MLRCFLFLSNYSCFLIDVCAIVHRLLQALAYRVASALDLFPAKCLRAHIVSILCFALRRVPVARVCFSLLRLLCWVVEPDFFSCMQRHHHEI